MNNNANFNWSIPVNKPAHKTFIIGLPRTGTTSISAALLEQGFKVAHTAYTQQSFHLADVVSDTPCYCDYKQLDQLFPGSRFIYLDRPLSEWIPSIQMLLKKIEKYIAPEGHFNPIIKRCFREVFGLKNTPDPFDPDHLEQCYVRHQKRVVNYFKDRNDLLSTNITDPNCLTNLADFLGFEVQNNEIIPHLNRGRMITAWKDIKHPNKVNSNASGELRRRFFDYAE